MRKMRIVGVALVALCAFGALMSTSASAALTFELALWLVNGADVTTPVETDSVGELLFHNVLNGAEFQCSGLFVGFVESESKDKVTKVFSLAGVENLLPSAGIKCTTQKTCEANPEVFAEKLPWTTEVEQDSETGKFVELITGAEYNFKCKVLGVTIEETCAVTAGTEAGEVLNVASDVETVGTAAPNSNCTGGTEEGQVTNIAGNLTSPVSGGTLAASLP